MCIYQTKVIRQALFDLLLEFGQREMGKQVEYEIVESRELREPILPFDQTDRMKKTL